MKTNSIIKISNALLLVVIAFSNIQAIGTNPLKLFYSQARTDNFTTATIKGSKDATAAGYRYAGVEGYVLSNQEIGTKPLKLYYSPTRKDNFLTATPQGERDAKAAGYRFARIEGYVYSNPGKGRKALKLYYSPSRKDNFTTATVKGEKNAKAAGYRFARIEGYVLTNPVAQNTGGGGTVSNNIPDRYNLPDNLRPAFESLPIWRLQLRVRTGGIKDANTDDEVYVKFNDAASGIYYLDRAGDDREKNRVNTYDILDPNIRTVGDIKMMQLSIKGNDGWCIQQIEILVNDVNIPVFSKKFSNCHWLDGNSNGGPNLYISGTELRRSAGWKYTSRNRAIWLPPTIIRRATLEAMVESYVGHMMNANPDMKHLEFGKKYGRAYVEAKQASSDKLHFDLDLAYTYGPDMETDVDFDLVVKCQNNKLSLQAQSVKAELNVPVISRLVRIFKSDFAKMNMGNFNFGNANVPFCPSIRVTPEGDITLRP